MEILAPAGSYESLVAAVRCGADAVYLGAKGLNARRNADNFDDEQLNRAVLYCKQRGVKVYLTANTLVADEEFNEAYHTIDSALGTGADGFIVQDLGLAKVIRECFPSARLHASTQCSASTPDGFRRLEELGFCRAVIPREMSADEIKEIRQSTSMELEAFVHGALCMSVSGQCYLSAMLGGRSGNRGLCAQPCRLKFSADGKGGCDLSLKDLSLIKHAREMEKLGVCSLKIEGRMKRPEYVAAAVTACRSALDGEYDADRENVLRSVFSRSGFTDGYFTGRRADMFGTRQKEDVVAAKEVLKDLSHLYDNENPLVPVTVDFSCERGKNAVLTVATDEKTVTVTGAVPEAAINKPMTTESVSARLSKFGGTQYYAHSVNIKLDDGLIIPAGVLNGMRRDAVEKLNAVPDIEYKKLPLPILSMTEHRAEPYLTASFLHPDTIPEDNPFERIFIPVWSEEKYFDDEKIGAELPRGLFGCEQKLKKQLTVLKELGVKKILASNIGAYKTAEDMGFDVFGGFGLNVFNSRTARQFRSPILSFELTLQQANAVSADDTGIIGYGKLPLMLTRNCPVKNRIGCEVCKKQGSLTDRKGFEFSVKCSPYPCVEIYNPIPLYMGDRMGEIHTDFVHLAFTDESAGEVCEIIKKYSAHAELGKKYTRGLYYRGVK